MLDGSNVDSILGFGDTNGDKLFARFSDLGFAPAAATSITAGATVSIGGGLATVTYASTANTAGRFEIASIAANGDAVLVVSGSVTGTTATAAHAQFVFDQSDGALWFDADGSDAGDAVKIAVLDPASTTATADGIVGTALTSSDFMFENG